jgi:hypothetical protein
MALGRRRGGDGGDLRCVRSTRPFGTSHRHAGNEAVDGNHLAAALLRPRIEESARILFPSILEPSGPPMQAFLIADASLQVYRASLTTFNYLGQAGPRPHKAIDVAEVQRVLPGFDPGHDAWMEVDPDVLRGLVRENVRVIWIHHELILGDSIPR